ncbi:hypothetical protein JH286_02285 [Xanthomonas campestris pv. campestris]|uniref:hypothetical protein n=1 Tax=Xanthomonas campestris TaxID=339 RepID=UPI002367D091|nr:hypothetical protein [Xanthomonas campestris]WDJ47755.1 hypothetical protein JH286_02285 [Xanthomonas campestris pv. campestris]
MQKPIKVRKEMMSSPLHSAFPFKAIPAKTKARAGASAAARNAVTTAIKVLINLTLELSRTAKRVRLE